MRPWEGWGQSQKSGNVEEKFRDQFLLPWPSHSGLSLFLGKECLQQIACEFTTVQFTCPEWVESFLSFKCLEMLRQCRDSCCVPIIFPVHHNCFQLPVRRLKHCIKAQLHYLAALCYSWEAWPQTSCSLTCLSMSLVTSCEQPAKSSVWACGAMTPTTSLPNFLTIPATSMGVLRDS